FLIEATFVARGRRQGSAAFHEEYAALRGGSKRAVSPCFRAVAREHDPVAPRRRRVRPRRASASDERGGARAPRRPAPRPGAPRRGERRRATPGCGACPGELGGKGRPPPPPKPHPDGVYNRPSGTGPLAFCRGCPAPEAPPEGRVPAAAASLGVGCVPCH